MAYHPDCSYSREAATAWMEMMLWMRAKNLDDKIDLYTINASESRNYNGPGFISGMGQIEGFPTIKLYHGADNVEEYDYKGFKDTDLEKFLVKEVPLKETL